MVYGGGSGNCLTGARFTMSATLLHQNDPYAPEGEIDLGIYGEWVNSQDPLTGEIVRVWKPFEDPIPETPDNETVTLGNIPCLARGIVDGGIRVAGTTEWFGDDYRNIDFVKLWTPPHIQISKRDRVTNIRDATGKIRWLDEEYSDPRLTEVPRATVFNVNGVTPLFDAANRLVEWYVMLERAEINVSENSV
jgi:hypothetical protein